MQTNQLKLPCNNEILKFAQNVSVIKNRKGDNLRTR